jgi:DNA (cytosine-5)-methyltransferase 1
MTQHKAIDLFCGAGGLSLGLGRAGFAVIAGIDHDGPSMRTYANNFGHAALQRDLSKLTVDELLQTLAIAPGEVALVAGGPPCQGFSVQRRGDDSDARNDLILHFLRIVRGLRPKFFLLENVPGLRSRRGATMLRDFLARAGTAGYSIMMNTLNAADFGVPQIRRRVFIVGERDGLPSYEFPVPTSESASWRTVRDALADLPLPPLDFSAHPSLANHQVGRMSELNVRRIAHVPEGGGWEHLPAELQLDCHRPGAAKIGHRYVYGRLSWDKPAGTITARFDSFTRGKFAHPSENRSITLREGARLQTFPDDFVFLGTKEEVASQIGNAVPPRLAETIGSSIIRTLDGLVPTQKRQLALPIAI